MSHASFQPLERLTQHGFVMLQSVFSVGRIDSLAQRLNATLQEQNDASILRSRGRVYGARDLLRTFPQVVALVSDPSLTKFSAAVLGEDAGIVRALFFDKPPDRSWSLPWHKDRTIAVKRNDLPSEHFHKPTVKAGVPHVEAPRSLLEKMLTIRIHLDAMTETNGPLYVVPGSHLGEDTDHQLPLELHAEVGGVLAMRPLLTHSSTMSKPGTSAHRRVIHIELAANRELTDGYEWNSFVAFR